MKTLLITAFTILGVTAMAQNTNDISDEKKAALPVKEVKSKEIKAIKKSVMQQQQLKKVKKGPQRIHVREEFHKK